MATIGSRGVFGRVADVALVAAIVIAPIAGGSVDRRMLPILVALALVAFAGTLLGRSSAGRRQHVSLLPIALFGLSMFTLLQAVPLPSGVLHLLSPRAFEVREMVGATNVTPISYEPAASVRAAAQLALYGVIAHVAYERATRRQGFAFVTETVVAAGVASVAIAGLHRLFGVERMLGILPSARPANRLLATFVNPNHAAGFLLLASLVALGLAVSQRRRRERVKYLGAAIVTAVVSALNLSRGGLLALGFGFVLFVFLLVRRRNEELEDRRSNAPAIIGVTVAIPIVWLAWRYTDVLREFTGREGDPLGVEGKLNAARDAWPLILDHPIFGIGRGAYASVYPAYKTATHQFTYTHPENLVVQLLSDWGVLIGLLAVVGLGVLVLARIRGARNAAILGAMVGVAALALQNLVDFSLEVPGVALPVAALLGAAGVGLVKEHRIDLKQRRGIALAALPIVTLVGTTAAALAVRPVEDDLAQLERAAWGRGVGPEEERVAARHPANAVAAARMAFAAETAEAPDLEAALRWANRTMFLAPTYADGHLVTGRLLLRLGHRRQAFTEMRRAWALIADPRKTALIDQVALYARTPEELLEAVPRRDPVMDLPDEAELAAAVYPLVARRRVDWAKALLRRIERVEAVRAGDLVPVAGAAIEAEEWALAEAVLAKRREIEPTDGRALRLTLEMLEKRKDVEGLRRLIDEATAVPDVDPLPFLKAELDLAVASRDPAAAREALEALRRRLPPTLRNQVYTAQMKAKIEAGDSHPAAAVRALDTAIRLAPGNPDLRVERAKLLLELGKPNRAKLDLTAALKLDPEHPAATRMMERVP